MKTESNNELQDEDQTKTHGIIIINNRRVSTENSRMEISHKSFTITYSTKQNDNKKFLLKEFPMVH